MLPRLTLPQLWLGLAIVLPGFASLLATLSTVDLAWQLRAGEAILAGNGIPRTDTYTFTVGGQPWLDQQWAAQGLLALIWQATSWTGLVLGRALLISAAWACLVMAIRRTAPRLSARWVAALALGAFVVTAPALALRPQLFGVLLFCLTLALLAGARLRPRLAWGVPLVAIAWANLHGSFFLAPLLVGLAWLEALRADRAMARRLLTVGVATAVGVLVNPFGFDVIRYAGSLSTNRELAARVTEWQPPTLAEPAGMLFFGSLVAVGLVLILRRRPPPLPAAMTLLLFAGLGLATARAVAWWPAVAVVTLAGLLQPTGHSARQSPPDVRRPGVPSAANAVLLVALILAAVPLLPAWRPADPDAGLGAPRGLLGQAPPGITRELRSIVRPDDRIWNHQPWGSWLELAVPVAPVAFDSRIELYPSALWVDHDAVAAARPGWPAILDRWGVTIVVAAGEQLALRAALEGSPDWRLAYADSDGALFVRPNRERRLAASPGPVPGSRGSAAPLASPILYPR